MENEELFKSKRRQIWQWCIIIILAFFIVIQFSSIHCENQVLANQFAFASTISSIILSVIAIIMTVVSSDSLNNLLHKFRDLHDEIIEVPNKINKSTESMNSASKGLTESISDMTETIHKIEEMTRGLPDKLREIKSDINNNSTNNYRETNSRSESAPSEIGILDETIRSFLGNTSTVGLLALYSLGLCKSDNRLFTFDEFEKTVQINSKDYVFGYLIALSSFYLIDLIKHSENELKVMEINNIITENIEEEIDDRIKAGAISSTIKEIIKKSVGNSPHNPTP